MVSSTQICTEKMRMHQTAPTENHDQVDTPTCSLSLFWRFRAKIALFFKPLEAWFMSKGPADKISA
jgi:hypothetical protein